MSNTAAARAQGAWTRYATAFASEAVTSNITEEHGEIIAFSRIAIREPKGGALDVSEGGLLTSSGRMTTPASGATYSINVSSGIAFPVTVTSALPTVAMWTYATPQVSVPYEFRWVDTGSIVFGFPDSYPRFPAPVLFFPSFFEGTPEKDFSALIETLRSDSSILNSERICDRVVSLSTMLVEDGEESISDDSLRGFLRFLQFAPRIQYPDIAATPSSRLYVRWRQGNSKLLAIEFLGASIARFALSTPSRRQPSLTERYSGTTSLEELFAFLSRCGVLAWITRNEG